MEKVTKEMKPIWYFVGLMLSTMGVVVLTAGIVRTWRGVQCQNPKKKSSMKNRPQAWKIPLGDPQRAHRPPSARPEASTA